MNSTYIPPFRRRSASNSNEERPFLTLQDLHARFNSNPPQMPRAQRLLNADDLHQKFKQSKQNAYPTPSDPASDPPPASPRSFRSLLPRPFLSKKLSMRLPDIQIFDGSKPDVFLDWKLKMLDKLRYNADHFIETNNEEREGFKIAYIVSRLDGEASTQTLWRRQYKPYYSVTELLNHLTDLYGIHPEIAKDICRQEFNKVEQAPKQSFDEFYRVFVKYTIFRKNKDDLMHEMKEKVNPALRKVLLPLPEDFTSLPAMTKWLKWVDYRHRAAKQLKQDEEKLKREQKLKQYRKQVAKTEKALAQQRQKRIRKEEEAQRRRHEKRIQARDEKAFQEVEAQHQHRLKDIQAREERAKLTRQQEQEEQAKRADQQAEQAQRARQQKHEQAEQARQSKQEAVARDEKKLVKKQSSKSKGPEIAARSHDEIYNVQIAAALQHQHNVDDVKCTGLPASYESCDEAFFPTSY